MKLTLMVNNQTEQEIANRILPALHQFMAAALKFDIDVVTDIPADDVTLELEVVDLITSYLAAAKRDAAAMAAQTATPTHVYGNGYHPAMSHDTNDQYCMARGVQSWHPSARCPVCRPHPGVVMHQPNPIFQATDPGARAEKNVRDIKNMLEGLGIQWDDKQRIPDGILPGTPPKPVVFTAEGTAHVDGRQIVGVTPNDLPKALPQDMSQSDRDWSYQAYLAYREYARRNAMAMPVISDPNAPARLNVTDTA